MTGVSPDPSLPSTPSSRTTTSLVAKLDQAFNDLTVVQARISTVSAILANRDRARSRLPLVVAVPVDPSPPPPSPLPLAPFGVICAGDRVRIKYPRHWQQPIGIAESFRSGFITVRTPGGQGLRLLHRAGTFSPP